MSFYMILLKIMKQRNKNKLKKTEVDLNFKDDNDKRLFI